MSNVYVGQLMMFGGNFAPLNFAFCNGQTTAISQNETLFSLLGTTYGGDGVSTFNLPDLQCRLPIHEGQGLGQPAYVIGQKSGSENITLTTGQIPAHSHFLFASTAGANASSVSTSNAPAVPNVAGGTAYVDPASGNNPALEAGSMSNLGLAGSNIPHSNMMPSLCISFVISLFGIYPSQN